MPIEQERAMDTRWSKPMSIKPPDDTSTVVARAVEAYKEADVLFVDGPTTLHLIPNEDGSFEMEVREVTRGLRISGQTFYNAHMTATLARCLRTWLNGRP